MKQKKLYTLRHTNNAVKEPTPRTEQLVMRAANRELLLTSADDVTSSVTRDRKTRQKEKRSNENYEHNKWAIEMFCADTNIEEM